MLQTATAAAAATAVQARHGRRRRPPSSSRKSATHPACVRRSLRLALTCPASRCCWGAWQLAGQASAGMGFPMAGRILLAPRPRPLLSLPHAARPPRARLLALLGPGVSQACIERSHPGPAQPTKLSSPTLSPGQAAWRPGSPPAWRGESVTGCSRSQSPSWREVSGHSLHIRLGRWHRGEVGVARPVSSSTAGPLTAALREPCLYGDRARGPDPAPQRLQPTAQPPHAAACLPALAPSGRTKMRLADYLAYCDQQHDEEPLYIFDS